LSGSKSLFETSVKQNKPIVICVIEMKLFVLNNKIIGFAPTGADPGFQVRGGAHLKKLRRAEGGAKFVWVFRVKIHDFTPKKQITESPSYP
jgi:hypothetical protein